MRGRGRDRFITIRVSDELYEFIKAKSTELNVSLRELIISILEEEFKGEFTEGES